MHDYVSFMLLSRESSDSGHQEISDRALFKAGSGRLVTNIRIGMRNADLFERNSMISLTESD